MNEPLVCVNHPNVATQLRCAKCEAPICAKCARRTPTGYICPTCQKGLQKRFESVVWYDYLIALIIAGAGSAIGSLFLPLLTAFWYGVLIILYAPAVGKITGRLLQAALRKHRGKRLFQVAVAAFILGGMPAILTDIVYTWMLITAEANVMAYLFSSLFLIGYQIAYLFLGANTLWRQLKGFSI